MTPGEPATTPGEPRQTEVGSVFVSNYPPYSFWKAELADAARGALAAPPRPETPLGLYLHIPFCRRRCKFCYFKVYTDQNADRVKSYLESLAREIELGATWPAVAGRPLKFVYFGGGTPSFISAPQLRALVDRARAAFDWSGVEEVAFECEPGTLTEAKLDTIREIGVTRLSLGIESFDDEILQENGRAHVSKEIERVLPWIAARGFAQLNVDLIAGMVGETDATWRATVERTVAVAPDSVTIYQLELPYNTVYSGQVLGGSGPRELADWPTKRAWHGWAFERLEQAGYRVASAYTAVRTDRPVSFVYRDSVWHGCDLLGTGVASFSHVGGVHFQNLANWEAWAERVAAGELPVDRAFVPDASERMTREWILQLKLGRVDLGYFQRKFGVDAREHFGAALEHLTAAGLLAVRGNEVQLTREGLLRADGLLPEFYAERYRNARYT